jgi:hypothetical protein
LIILALKWHLSTQSPQSLHKSPSWAAIISEDMTASLNPNFCMAANEWQQQEQQLQT